MNSLKPLILLVILGGVAFGVYRSLSKESSAPPPGTDTSITAAPDIKLGEINSGAANQRDAKTPGPNLLRPAPGGAAPPFNAGNIARNPAADTAPPFTAELGRRGAADSAPPFSPGLPASPAGAQYAGSNESPGTPSSAHAGGALVQGGPGAESFTAAWSAIQPNLSAGQLTTALKDLTAWHNHPSLGAGERETVNRLLGQLAGTVIYSREHLLAAPYRVQAGERLEDIAAKFNVTPELLAKINELDPAAATLASGDEIKVVPGPFSAILDVAADRLTVIVDGCYAGSFAVADVGADVSARVQTGTPVEFTVSQKTTSPIYNSAAGEIEAGAPANPLGGHLLTLGSELALHGTNPNASREIKQPQAGVRMSAADIVDVYDILTVGSRVIVRK